MSEGEASSEDAKIAQNDSHSNSIVEGAAAGEREDTVAPTEELPINEQKAVEGGGVGNGNTNKSHTESSAMERATSTAGVSSDTTAKSDAKVNGNILKEDNPAVEPMARKVDQSDEATGDPSSTIDSKPKLEDAKSAAVASAAEGPKSDPEGGANVASQSSFEKDMAVGKDEQEDSKKRKSLISDEPKSGIADETPASTEDLPMKTPEKEEPKDSMVVMKSPNEEESNVNGNTESEVKENQGSRLGDSTEPLEEEEIASSPPTQESQNIDRKPSPVLIEDMDLMKTNEELPPFDFGSPKSEAERRDTPWATSTLPPHIEFLLSRNIVPEKEPAEKTESNDPGQATREVSLSIEDTPIPKDWSSTSEVKGNKSQVKEMPPPEPGMEDFVLQHRPERLRAKKEAALQAKVDSRQAEQNKQFILKGPQQDQRPSKGFVAAAGAKASVATSMEKVPPTAAQAETPAQAPGMPSSCQNQNPSQKSASIQKLPPSSQGKCPASSQNPASAHSPKDGNNAGRYFPPPLGQYNYGHSASTVAKKPIRRLAKIRPYANQSTPFSAEEIQNAIPKDASSVFHIMDRRINLDAFEVDETSVDAKVPIYSLLRAWVQDDPYRQIPPPPIILPTRAERYGHFQSWKDLVRQAKRRRDEANMRDGEHRKKRPKLIVDVFGHMQGTQSSTSQAADPSSSTTLPSLDFLKQELVEEARAKKKVKSKAYNRTLVKTLQSLRERGIVQGL